VDLGLKSGGEKAYPDSICDAGGEIFPGAEQAGGGGVLMRYKCLPGVISTGIRDERIRGLIAPVNFSQGLFNRRIHWRGFVFLSHHGEQDPHSR
jgi:hypothetical protein